MKKIVSVIHMPGDKSISHLINHKISYYSSLNENISIKESFKCLSKIVMCNSMLLIIKKRISPHKAMLYTIKEKDIMPDYWPLTSIFSGSNWVQRVAYRCLNLSSNNEI